MPSIVYGVFRTKVIKEISIEDFDYADLHLTHILAMPRRADVRVEGTVAVR